MKAVIIEDEMLAAKQIVELLARYRQPVEVVAAIGSLEQAKIILPTIPRADIYLLDIRLSDGTIFDLAEEFLVKGPVIFITAYDSYMVRCFEFLCIDYLLKPVRAEKLYKSLDKLSWLTPASETNDFSTVIAQLKFHLESMQKRQYTLLVNDRDSILPVGADNIAYFESRYGQIKCTQFDGRSFFLTASSLDQLTGSVDTSQFYRVNRNRLLNRRAIKGLRYFSKEKWQVIVFPDAREPVFISRMKLSAFKNWLAGPAIQ